MEESDYDYPFGARLIAYKPEYYESRGHDYTSSKFERDDGFYTEEQLGDRLAELFADGFHPDDCDVLIFLDEELATARVVSQNDEFYRLVNLAQAKKSAKEEERRERVRRYEEDQIRRQQEAIEASERKTYELLHAKYGAK